MTVKLLKLTSHVLKACKCHPHISVLNTMALIRLKYFNPRATKPFCTTEKEQTRLRHQSTGKGTYYNRNDLFLFYLNAKSVMSPSSMEIFFNPRNISLSS